MRLRLLLGMFVFVGGTMVALQSASAKDKKSTKQAKKHKHDDHAGHDHAGHDHAGHDHAGHDHDGKAPEMGEMSPEMMAKWMQSMTPGEHHAHLAPFVGSWKYTNKWRMAPDAPWSETGGVAKVHAIMDGRYIVQNIDGDEFMGMKFKGMGVTGYDNMRQKYVSTWMDNMSTTILMTEGTCDNSGKVITFTGKMDDCMTDRKDVAIKEVLTVINNDKHTFAWWFQAPSGEMYLSMEIVYTRQ